MGAPGKGVGSYCGSGGRASADLALGGKWARDETAQSQTRHDGTA